MPMSDYYMHLSKLKLAGLIVEISSNTPTSEWIADANGGLTWRAPSAATGTTERMIIKDANICITQYEDSPTAIYPVTAKITDIVDLNTGQGGNMPVGPAWYGPQFQLSHPWRIRQWGDCNGTGWYWQSDFFPGQTQTNLAWTNPAERVQTDCLKQIEAWYWNDSRGWAVGGGSGSPFDPKGNPQLVQVIYGQESYWAPSKGLWTFRVLPTGSLEGVQSIWSW